MTEPFEHVYPHVASWVVTQGWVEIGLDPSRRSFIRALDEGGMVWEGTATYPTLDAALRALDTALRDWMHQQHREG
jgi:hypothetical protein